MDQGSFVFAAYAVVVAAMGWLIVTSMLAMKRSEALAKDLSRKD